ncbi:MAG: T9SS type A sorting domain-containing protein, partial [Calditrichales bacterium]|nr:T9SS type A sorting domain-containing protein [Calditrichales bacterium]
KIYFAESHKIGRANLDGSGRTELITGLGTILRGINLAHNVPTTISDEYIVISNFTLHQNYPNPFNPTTTISYQLPAISQVDLGIYNLLGQKVATLVSQMQSAGNYTVEWDASGFASGVFCYKLETDKGFTQSRKLVLLK